ncbi:MAG: NosD domain-containing protein [bacterium]
MKNFFGTTAVCVGAFLATADGATRIVPDTYSTIQAAVDAAIANDTIQVNPGTYTERVSVAKSVKILGSDPATTIVDADGTGTNFLLTADGITIAGFTIKNSYVGLSLSYADNCLFSNLIVSGITSFGTFSRTAKSNTFANCVFVSNTSYALCLSDTSSSYNTITNCDFHDNYIALQAYANCSYLRVANSTFYNNAQALQLGWINPWLVENCGIYSNSGGISVDTASGGAVRNCEITYNAADGIGVGGMGSYLNTFESNNIVGNGRGVNLSVKAQRNTVRANTIALNGEGVQINRHPSDSYLNYSNRVYGNDFIGNATNGYVPEDRYTNFFDNGYPAGGNYWDDYTGVDVLSGPAQDQPGSDGIGDTPIVLSPKCKDTYPLMTCSRSVPPVPPFRSSMCFMSPSSGRTRTPLAGSSSPGRSICPTTGPGPISGSRSECVMASAANRHPGWREGKTSLSATFARCALRLGIQEEQE